MGSLCSTSRSVQVREKSTPTRRGQKTDTRMNPTPPRMQFTGESNFTHKHSCNDKDDSRSLTLANPYTEEKIITDVKQSEEKKIVVEMENRISEDPEHITKGNEQPESPETESAKIDASNEPSNTNQSENAKIDTEAPINEIGGRLDQSTIEQPLSPESTTVEINTPRRDLNTSLDSQDEEIKIEQPLFSHGHTCKSPTSTEEIAQDMIPKSSRIGITPKFPAEKKTSLTSKPDSPTDTIIPEPPIENALPAKTQDITVSPAKKEIIPETELKSETGATPENIEEAIISPTREVTSPDADLDNTVPVPTQATPEEATISPTIPETELKSETGATPENIEEATISPTIPETELKSETGATPENIEEATISPTIPETELKSETGATPEKMEEATISPTREVTSPEADLDNTAPVPTRATPEETGENKDLNSPKQLQDNSHELITVTPEGEDRLEDPVSQETEKVIEENAEPRGNIENISNSDSKDLPKDDCIEAAKETNDGEINNEPAKSDTLEETIIDETAKDIIKESEEKI